MELHVGRPAGLAASLKVLDLFERGGELRDGLRADTSRFRCGMTAAGFDVLPGEHPIVPVMYGDASAAVLAAERLLETGPNVIAFSYPVVPHGAARIRTQLSPAHTTDDIEFAVECFKIARH